MRDIVNLTPHEINVGGRTIAPSDIVARVSTVDIRVGEINGITLYNQEFGEVTGLPEAGADLLIVSGMVRAACPDRTDLASPGRLVRDDAGRVVGCEGLVVN